MIRKCDIQSYHQWGSEECDISKKNTMRGEDSEKKKSRKHTDTLVTTLVVPSKISLMRWI